MTYNRLMLPTLPFLFIDLFVCSCVSKSEREGERAGGLARVCVCVCVLMRIYVAAS